MRVPPERATEARPYVIDIPREAFRPRSYTSGALKGVAGLASRTLYGSAAASSSTMGVLESREDGTGIGNAQDPLTLRRKERMERRHGKQRARAMLKKAKQGISDEQARRFVWKMLRPLLASRNSHHPSAQALRKNHPLWRKLVEYEHEFARKRGPLLKKRGNKYKDSTVSLTSSARKKTPCTALKKNKKILVAVHETSIAKSTEPNAFCTANMVRRGAREATNSVFAMYAGISPDDSKLSGPLPLHPEPRVGLKVTSRRLK
ncbi:unnamed protein product [Amoebophrya sp. A25]|nr:unnamed protein product [Amoebophrya sp. A25]|eukprot:GSA25T00008910001.1